MSGVLLCGMCCVVVFPLSLLLSLLVARLCQVCMLPLTHPPSQPRLAAGADELCVELMILTMFDSFLIYPAAISSERLQTFNYPV